MRLRPTPGPAIATLLIMAQVSCRPPPQLDVELPASGDWLDCGPVLHAGAPGSWDHLLYGGFAGSAVAKAGRILLYYQGASGERESGDRTPLRRAIGVAISEDGIHFEKHTDNPVLTWLPNDGPEEGATAGTAALDADGRVVLFYGANSEIEGTMYVNADVRVARSADGLEFRDLGLVLDHGSQTTWGSGDELFPLAALHDGSRWVVYYVPGGTSEGGALGVAWGDRPEGLVETSPVRGRLGRRVRAWGMGSVVRVAPRYWALFTNRVREGIFQVHLVDPSEPAQAIAPSRSYAFEPPVHGTVLLDRERGRWLLYDRREDHYRVRVASTGAVAAGAAESVARICG